MMQFRLLSHVNRCVQQYHMIKKCNEDEDENENEDENDAFHNLDNFYFDQNKLIETKKMYQRALNEKKKTLNSKHTSTLDIVHNLNNFYFDQSKLVETKKMYQRTLNEYKKA